MPPPTPLRPSPKAARATAVLALLAALSLPLAATATQRFDEGAWSAAIPADPAEPCELTTGGYDHAVDEQDPLLLIAIARDDRAATLRVNAITVTELTQPELLRARAKLKVDGPAARSVALVPAAIVETDFERRVTFRPRPAGGEQAGLRDLVDAMRRAERVRVEINGVPLEPAFSMQGLDAIWQRALPACGRKAAFIPTPHRLGKNLAYAPERKCPPGGVRHRRGLAAMVVGQSSRTRALSPSRPMLGSRPATLTSPTCPPTAWTPASSRIRSMSSRPRRRSSSRRGRTSPRCASTTAMPAGWRSSQTTR